MPTAITSLLLGLRQLLDGRVLRILLKSLVVTLLAFVVVAFAGYHAIDWGIEWLGLSDNLFAGAQGVRGAASALLAVIGLWLTWRILAMAVIQFYAEDVVKAVEARHYPHAASAARDLPLGEQVANSAKAAGRALVANLIALPFALALLFTGIGPWVVFWLVNAVLVGRELQDMVWLRHRRDGAQAAPVSRGERFTLGGVIAGLLAIPFVNLLAPVLGAAGAAHLVHRKDRKDPA